MTPEERKRLSKYLSLVLRHRPSAAGISLDEAGWVDVESLRRGAASHGRAFSREELDEVVRTSDKQRFALSEDGSRVRANQGHSVAVELGLSPAIPPPRLFHGTVAGALESIRAEGLRPMSRHHVHLSADRETAARVGARRGRPVVLELRADEMVEAGATFFCSENGVWLTAFVPPSVIEFPA